MRVLAQVRDGRATLWSRNENDVTVTFPELSGLADIGHDVLLDGEVIALSSGLPTFAALADRMHVKNARRAQALVQTNPVTLIVFDLLALDGRDVTGLTWTERRALLESLDLDDVHWQVPAAYDDGRMLQEATAAQGLEGVVSKKVDSLYFFGRRSKDWLKFPHRPTASYVVGGWRFETGSDSRLGALLVGEPTADGLRYRGRVGSGIAGQEGPRLRELLTSYAAERSPFVDDVPRVDALGTTWVRPEVVVELASLGLTSGGRLRQPSFQGIRTDLTAAELGGE